MTIPLDTGDRVAWTEHDRGIVVAADPVRVRVGRELTVAVWRGGAFSGHLTRIGAGRLFRTLRLASPAERTPQPPSDRPGPDEHS